MLKLEDNNRKLFMNNNQHKMQLTHYPLLAKAPAIIFLLVSGTTGTIDKKQIKQLTKLLASKDYQLLITPMQQDGSSLTQILTDLQLNKEQPLQQLQNLNAVLNHDFPEQLAHKYKTTLLQLAHAITQNKFGFIKLLFNQASLQNHFVIETIANELELDENAIENIRNQYKMKNQTQYSY